MYYINTGVTSYLTQAENVWNWMATSGALGPKSVYLDGPAALPGSCGSDTSLFTYNTGQMLGAAGALYTATGNKTYLTSGNATLNALVTSTDFNMNGVLFESTCDATACTGNDNAWSFKGITMEGVQYFLDAANDPTITSLYSPWIGFQAMSINKNAGTSNGDIGNVWYQASPQVRNAATLGMAISAGNAAVKYGANDGTFTC
ncbi:glycoside hydrolase [Mycena leptocephala]|nr:glycoside hydrolase [Mycena leptocephala]